MSISLPQIIIIALIVIIVFGTGKFPTIMENIAKGIKAFNKGLASEEPIIENKKAPAKKSPAKKTTTKKPATKKKTK